MKVAEFFAANFTFFQSRERVDAAFLGGEKHFDEYFVGDENF